MFWAMKLLPREEMSGLLRGSIVQGNLPYVSLWFRGVVLGFEGKNGVIW